MGFIGSAFSDDAGLGWDPASADIKSPKDLMERQDNAYNQSQQGLDQQQSFISALQGQNGIGNQSSVFNQQQALANQLGQQAQGQGPNPAMAQLNQTTGQNVANQAALMAGQRGAGANAGLMARQAAMQGAGIQQQAVGQGAAMAAQQQIAAQQALQGQQAQMAGVAGQQVAQQGGAIQAFNQNAQGLNNAYLNAIGNQNTANVNMTSNRNTTKGQIANTNAQGQQAMLGGLISGISGAGAGMAYGGMVQGLAEGGTAGGGGFLSKIGSMFGSGGGGAEAPPPVMSERSAMAEGVAPNLSNMPPESKELMPQNPQSFVDLGRGEGVGQMMSASPQMEMPAVTAAVNPANQLSGGAPIPQAPAVQSKGPSPNDQHPDHGVQYSSVNPGAEALGKAVAGMFKPKSMGGGGGGGDSGGGGGGGGMMSMMGGEGGGGMASMAAMFSDERAKKNKEPAGSSIDDLLNHLAPEKYEYKDPSQSGAAGGQRYGVMAQDLEKSKAGASIVKDTPQGKMVDTNQGVGVLMASVAELNKRLNALEGHKMSQGGKVPGAPNVGGDDPKNDTVPTMLSPGEVVIPRSIMQHERAPELAAAFVAREMKKNSSMKPQMFAGGQQGNPQQDQPQASPQMIYQNALGNRLESLQQAAGGRELAPQEKMAAEKDVLQNMHAANDSRTLDQKVADFGKDAPNMGFFDKLQAYKPLADQAMQQRAGADAQQLQQQNYARSDEGQIAALKAKLGLDQPQGMAAAPMQRIQDADRSLGDTAHGMPSVEGGAPKSAGQIAQGMGPNGPMSPDYGYRQQIAGINAEAKAAGQLGKEKEMLYADQMGREQKNYADAQRTLADIEGHQKQFMSDLAGQKIDPNHYMDSRTTGTKITQAISLMLGGMGGGLTGKSNPAMDYINGQINRDIDAQKSNMGNTENLLKFNMQRYGNLKVAQDITRSSQLAMVEMGLRAAEAKNTDPQAKARAQQAIGQINVERGRLNQGAAMQLKALNDPNMPIEQRMNVLITDNTERSRAREELSRINMAENASRDVQNMVGEARKIGYLGSMIPYGGDKTKLTTLNTTIGNKLRLAIKEASGGQLSDDEAKQQIAPLLLNGSEREEQVNSKLSGMMDVLKNATIKGTPTLSAYKLTVSPRFAERPDSQQALMNFIKANENSKDPATQQRVARLKTELRN